MLNDVWRYEIATNKWFFVKGNASIDPIGEYSTDASGYPGGRMLPRIASLSNDSFFLFGGSNSPFQIFNDIWILYCNESTSICPCINGLCTNGSMCSCYSNFTGDICDQSCLDQYCSVGCLCFNASSCNGNNYACQNNLSIIQKTGIQTVSIATKIIYTQGKLNIQESKVDLTDTILKIDQDIIIQESDVSLTNTILSIAKNIVISNSNLFFFSNSSSIITNGCLNMNISNLTVYLNDSIKYENITLFNSTKRCLPRILDSIQFMHGPCLKLSTENNENILSVILLPDPCSTSSDNNRSETPNDNIWIILIIIVIIVVVLAISFGLLVKFVPQVRDFIFPSKKIREQIKLKSMQT